MHHIQRKWIGFDVSPLKVQHDRNMEEYIVMKINKANIVTRMMYDFDIPVSTTVKIYNEKDVMGKRRTVARRGVIIDKQGVLFKARTNMGDELIPRFKITY